MAAASSSSSTSPLVLVTGASGFLGAHIVRTLLTAGWTVRGTVRDPSDEVKVAPLKALDNADTSLELVEADLLKDDGWTAALAGVTHVIHSASPFPIQQPKNKDLLIKPAVEGTLRVLKAAAASGGVQRVVVTSSVAAIAYGHKEGDIDGKKYTEEDWSDLEAGLIQPYPESKTRAERAAWDFVKEAGSPFELAVINPSYIVGPIIRRCPFSSVDILANLVERRFTAVPDLNMWAVDVRDVAEAHVRAMLFPEAAGKRFILSAREIPMREIATTLAADLNPLGYNVPTAHASNFFIRFAGCFDATAAAIAPMLGQHQVHDHSRAETVLGIEFRDISAAVIALARSGISMGLIKPPASAKETEFDVPMGDVRIAGISPSDASPVKDPEEAPEEG